MAKWLGHAGQLFLEREPVAPVALDKLLGLETSEEIGRALTELCRPYGNIVRMEIMTDGDGARICLISLSSIGQNAALCRELGGFPVGFSVGLRIPARRAA